VHDSATVPVQLAELSFGMAAVVANARLKLELNRPVTVEFSHPEMAIPARLRVNVRSRSPHGEQVRYVLEFINPEHLQTRLPAKALADFNRRAAFRVAPDSDAPIVAQVHRLMGNVRMELSVVSISATGVGCMAWRLEQQRLMTGDKVVLSFSIPDTSNVCSLAGIVRYAARQRGAVRFGIEFDGSQTQLFLRQQQAIARYVMEQQRKMLAID
jgi:c-di-GMP-binding flagellar brake protein YcgR